MTHDLQARRQQHEAHTAATKEAMQAYAAAVKAELDAHHQQAKELEDKAARKAAKDELKRRIEAIRAQYHFQHSPAQIKGFEQSLHKSLFAEIGIWLFKLGLAFSVAFPGHLALGEMLGFSGSYLGGVKFFPMAWLPIATMLLVAEYFIILGANYFFAGKDNHFFLRGGYQISHFNRGLSFSFTSFSQVREKYLAALGFWAIAGGICLLDAVFNVRYLLEQTEDWFIALIASSFFTALLVGLSLLLALVFEYRRSQLKLTLEAADFVVEEPAPKPPVATSPTPPIAPKPAVPPELSLFPDPPKPGQPPELTSRVPFPPPKTPEPIIREIQRPRPTTEPQAPAQPSYAAAPTAPTPGPVAAGASRHAPGSPALAARPRTRLQTLSQRAEFEYEITQEQILIYPKGNESLPIKLDLALVERLLDEFRGRSFVDLGTSFSAPPAGSLGHRLKDLSGQNSATYLGPILKAAGMIETRGSHPIQVCVL